MLSCQAVAVTALHRGASVLDGAVGLPIKASVAVHSIWIVNLRFQAGGLFF